MSIDRHDAQQKIIKKGTPATWQNSTNAWVSRTFGHVPSPNLTQDMVRQTQHNSTTWFNVTWSQLDRGLIVTVSDGAGRIVTVSQWGCGLMNKTPNIWSPLQTAWKENTVFTAHQRFCIVVFTLSESGDCKITYLKSGPLMISKLMILFGHIPKT
jgi:hypothetical protein